MARASAPKGRSAPERPADLGEIVADSLDALRLQARMVLGDIPSTLCQVMADPAIMERG